MNKILFPWRIRGDFEDGETVYANAFSEEEATELLLDLVGKHGPLVAYCGVCDENYIEGELRE